MRMKPLSMSVALLASTFALPAYSADFFVTDSAGFRDALEKAAANAEDDTITLAEGVYSTSGTPFIFNSARKNNLTIKGAGRDKTRLDGGRTDTAAGSNVLILINKYEYGVSAEFKLIDLNVENGALGYSAQNSDSIIENVLFSKNANGAIASDKNTDTVKVKSSYFKDNDNSAIWAIKVDVEGSLFESNKSNNGYGGAIRSSVSTIRNTQFIKNKAGYGGALYVSSQLVVENCFFEENEVTKGATGAALHGGTTNISSSVFSDNKTSVSLADIVKVGGRSVIYSSVFLNNSASSATIYSAGSNSKVVNSLFDSNNVLYEIADVAVVANTVFVGGKAETKSILSQGIMVDIVNNFIDKNKIQGAIEHLRTSDNIHAASAGFGIDYTPVAGSPLINAGLQNDTLFILPKTDLLSNARISDGQVDINVRNLTHKTPSTSLFFLA